MIFCMQQWRCVCFQMIFDVSLCPSPGSFTVFKDRHGLALPNCVWEHWREEHASPLFYQNQSSKMGWRKAIWVIRHFQCCERDILPSLLNCLLAGSCKISLEELRYPTLSRAGIGTEITLDAGSPFHRRNTETKRTQSFIHISVLAFPVGYCRYPNPQCTCCHESKHDSHENPTDSSVTSTLMPSTEIIPWDFCAQRRCKLENLQT